MGGRIVVSDSQNKIKRIESHNLQLFRFWLWQLYSSYEKQCGMTLSSVAGIIINATIIITSMMLIWIIMNVMLINVTYRKHRLWQGDYEWDRFVCEIQIITTLKWIIIESVWIITGLLRIMKRRSWNWITITMIVDFIIMKMIVDTGNS